MLSQCLCGSFLLLLVSSTLISFTYGRNIQIDVKADWVKYPLSYVTEISEFLFDQNPAYYWQYLDSLCAHSGVFEDVAVNSQSESATAAAADVAGEAQMLAYDLAHSVTPSYIHTLLDTMVGVGHYAPSIQFFLSMSRKFGNPCDGNAFLVVYPGEVVHCKVPADWGDIAHVLATQKERSGTTNTASSVASSSSSSSSSIDIDWFFGRDISDPEWDHVYADPSFTSTFSSSTGMVTVHNVVLYGTLGRSSFCSMHKEMVASLPESPTFSYSVRPAPTTTSAAAAAAATEDTTTLTSTSVSTGLQGYGVFLDIKNMEYKNVDDSSSEKEKKRDNEHAEKGREKEDQLLDDSQEPVFDSAEEVMGVSFDTLFKKLPHRGSALHSLRQQLLRQADEDAANSGGGGGGAGELKVWNMKDLGLQTLKLIHSAGALGTSADAMSKFAEIVHNFPRYASMVSATKLQRSATGLKEDVESWYRSGIRQTLPSNAIFVNGRKFDLDGNTFNVYDLFDQIRAEFALQHKLFAVHNSTDVQRQVGHLAREVAAGGGAGALSPMEQQMGGPIVRIDVSKGGKHVVKFVNNLEKDPQYQNWPRSLRQLAMPSWQLHSLARNMFTVVANVDPITKEGAHMILQLQMMMEQMYPVRVGLVFACTPTEATFSAVNADEMTTVVNDIGDENPEHLNNPNIKTCYDFVRLYARMEEEKGTENAFAFAVAVAEHVAMASQRQLMGGHGMEEEEDAQQAQSFIRRLLGEDDDEDEDEDGRKGSEGALAIKTRPSFIDKVELVDAFAIAAAESTSIKQKKPFIDTANRVLTQRMHTDLIVNTTLYMQARGLASNSFSLNGIVMPPGNELGNSLMQLLGREQFILGQLYQKKSITDKTKSLFSAILEAGKAYPRYHPMLENNFPEYSDFSSLAGQQLLSSLKWYYGVEGRGGASTSTSARTDDHQAVCSVTSVDSGECVVTQAAATSTTPAMNTFNYSSSTILYVPMTPGGFKAVSTGLKWSVFEAENGNNAHRIAVVLQLDDAAVSEISRYAASGVDAATFLVGEESEEVEADIAEKARSLSLLHFAVSSSSSSSSSASMVLLDSVLSGLAKNKPVRVLLRDLLAAPPSLSSSSSSSAIEEETKVHLKAWLDRSTTGGATSLVLQALDHFATLNKLASECLGTPENEQLPEIVVSHNSRKLVVPATATALHPLDLSLVSSLEHKKVGSSLAAIVPLPPAVGGAEFSQHVDASDFMLRAASFCGHYSSLSSTRYDVGAMLEEFGSVTQNFFMSGSTEAATETTGNDPFPSMVFRQEALEREDLDIKEANTLDIYLVVDPLSVAGQRAAALVPLLRDQLNYAHTVVLVPQLEVTEFPLQNFYRFVLDPRSASKEDESSAAVAALFSALPRQHTLTVRVDMPEPWNVQSTKAVQDIDNLRCSDKLCGDAAFKKMPAAEAALDKKDLTQVSYTVKSLLVAGQCLQTAAKGRMGLPPNGLQLTMAPLASYRHHVHTALSSINSNSANASSTAEAILSRAPDGQVDSLVMQNLGYFQLQAKSPGLYVLNLASGRASDLYCINNNKVDSSFGIVSPPRSAASGEEEGHEEGGDVVDSAGCNGKPGVLGLGGTVVAVRTFGDSVRRLIVSKRPGKETVSLLDTTGDADDAMQQRRKMYSHGGKAVREETAGANGAGAEAVSSGAGAWSAWASKLLGRDGGAAANDKTKSVVPTGEGAEHEQETIHVFSLATGHMYERLLRIMMLSVSRQASAPVKFWLLENYLSPTFKEMAAVMSQEFGFEVAYVTYKWPQWLTQQTQQQRIIWGLKILFLDVMFPLDVKRIIYVDADQVVRADLKELWDMDLQGKPYAYTPFCTSREETLGFQFWRHGYWKDHLRGLPYHISALYVVDLQRFRRNAVGDTLRSIYDQLARDPNSLANLDQDLPNFAQHQVPIHSLPQEWLWCETWCSDESKTTAKTIDLCNNPLHKEPKLDMARRVISGPLFNQSWVSLDDEIRNLERKNGFLLNE